ncbi:MAG: DUF4115 domain-containing protein [Alphaproteobacteria bacterium]|nr:DUF4115 domain-containing protein [Alphaproteobacteria bacterium]
MGDALRAAREAHGWTVQDVAGHLRIRSNFLQALEESRADLLPGVAYAIGYMRVYATFLGLDPDDAVGRFKDEEASVHSRTELVFPSPAPEGRVPGLAVLLLAAVLAGGAYGGWYVIYERDGGLRGLVPNVPERLAALIDGDTSRTADVKPVDHGAAVTARSATTPTARRATTPDDTASVETRVAEPSTNAMATVETTSAVPVTMDTSVGQVDVVRDEAAPSAPGPAENALIPDPESVTAVRVLPDTVFDTAPLPIPTVTATHEAAAGSTDGALPIASANASSVPSDSPPPDTVDIAAVRVTAAPASRDSDPSDLASGPAPVATDTASDTATDTAIAAVTPTEPAVPSAPRIGGLIGASEAAVPTASASGLTTTPVDRLVIRASGDSWVQIRDEAGHTLYTRVMREGDVYRVPDRAGLSLATGNAGALEILVEGRMAPSLGAFGEVVRNVALTPSRLIAGTAVGAGN